MVLEKKSVTAERCFFNISQHCHHLNQHHQHHHHHHHHPPPHHHHDHHQNHQAHQAFWPKKATMGSFNHKQSLKRGIATQGPLSLHIATHSKFENWWRLLIEAFHSVFWSLHIYMYIYTYIYIYIYMYIYIYISLPDAACIWRGSFSAERTTGHCSWHHGTINGRGSQTLLDSAPDHVIFKRQDTSVQGLESDKMHEDIYEHHIIRQCVHFWIAFCHP